MKKGKFLISLLLAIAILSSISVSAFAAEAPNYVVNQFRNFQFIEQGHNSTYVRIAQRFLLNYNWTTANFISKNGGVDGDFGTGTHNATYEFQKNVFNYWKQWDGKIGSDTWEQICRNMDFVDTATNTEGTSFEFYRGNNLIVWRVGSTWSVRGGDGLRYDIYV